jgi:mitotic spindle assembly checkpoint protein MAD2
VHLGIYQPETFRREEKYGLTVLTTTDDGLLEYLNNVMTQVEAWLTSGDVQKLVVVVAGIDSGETLERWQFNVSVEDPVIEGKLGGTDENHPQNIQATAGPMKKSLKEIHNEIQAIIRQITASVSTMNVRIPNLRL